MSATTPRSGPTTVVDLRGRRDDPDIADVIYVGRAMYRGGWRLPAHPLANPLRIGRDGTAEQVVDRYRAWVLARPNLDEQLAVLRGRRLGCWCGGDQPCHARVLAELADALPLDSSPLDVAREKGPDLPR